MSKFDGFSELFSKMNNSIIDSKKTELLVEPDELRAHLLFEPLEPRVMLAADLAALNMLASSTYLEDVDKYLEGNVFTQDLMLLNDNLQYEDEVKDFVSNIDQTLANFSLTDGEFSIQGFKDEINTLFPAGDDNYGVQIAISGNEYSDALLFQLDFSFSYTAKMDAGFNIDDDNFKLITMISNFEDGRSVDDMVEVDIDLALSYSFAISEALPVDDPVKFYVDQTDAGGPDGIAGQYIINDKSGNLLYKQKVNSGALVTDGSGNAIYTDKDGNGEYHLNSNSHIQNQANSNYLAIDAGGSVSEVATEDLATAIIEYDTVFSVKSKQADSSGNGGAFELNYEAVLSDNFSAIGKIGGMTALVYEKDNVNYELEVGTDNNLTYGGNPVSTALQLIDMIENALPADKSTSDMMFDFYADHDVSSESRADGRIVTSIGTTGISNYSTTYNSENNTFTVETGLTEAEFETLAGTTLVDEDVDIYLAAKMALIPDLDNWTDLDLDEDWLTDNLSDFAVFPELKVESPILIHSGKTALDIATIKGETYSTNDALQFEKEGAFQEFEVLFAPAVLDVGMFWGNMIDSFVNELGVLFDPIMPAVELLLGEMPGLSDLTELAGLGECTTMDFLQGIAALYSFKDSGKAAGALAVAESALEFIYLLNKGEMPADSQPEEIPGDLKLGVFKFNKTIYDSEEEAKKKAVTEANASDDTKDDTDRKTTEDKAKKKTTTKEVTVGGSFDVNFDTPLFTSPDKFILGIMAGDTSVSLFNLDLLLEAAIEMEVTIPFLSVGIADLSLIIKPKLGVSFNVGVGFDLVGMDTFMSRLEWDPSLGHDLEALHGSVLDNTEAILKEGFYFDDHYDVTKSEDGKEFKISLGIELGLSVGIPDLGPVTIRAGVAGGLTFEFGVDLNDMPTKLPYDEWRDDPVDTVVDKGMLYKYDSDQAKWAEDHHVHLNELKDMHRAKNYFAVSVSAKFSARIFVEIGLDLGIFDITLIDWSMTLFEITLFEAALSSPASHYDIIVNTAYVPPVMAGWQDQSSGVLELYTGDKASQRQYTNADGTGQDSITDEKYIINSLGFTQVDGTYDSSVDAGLGETIQINFNGGTQEVKNVKKIVGNAGDGDDKIQIRGKGSHKTKIVVDVDGGAGDDILSYTGLGAARMLGSDGHDRLVGGDGADYIYGGAGNDILYGRNGVDYIYGNDGYDQIDGGEGNDILDGGSGGYELVADTDDADGDNDKEELINGDYFGDEYRWSYGDGSDKINDTGTDDGANKDYDKLSITGSTQRAGRSTLQKSDDVNISANESGKFLVEMNQTWSGELAAQRILTIDGVEEVMLGINGGGDTIDVFDYSGSDVEMLALGLDYDTISTGGAELNIQGTSGDDTIKAYTERQGTGGNTIDVFNITRQAGAGSQYIMGVNSSDVDTDYLNIYGLGGNDTLSVISDNNTKVSQYLALGTIDGGTGNDTITVTGVNAKPAEYFKVIGGDGNDTITVNSSNGFVIAGEDKEIGATVSTDDTVTVTSSYDFRVNTGNGTNAVTISESNDFSLIGGNSSDTLTSTNIDDFSVDLGAGVGTITINKKATDGKFTTGSGRAIIKNQNIDNSVAYSLARLDFSLAGGNVLGNDVDLTSAQAVVLTSSDEEDTIKFDKSKNLIVNAGGGIDNVTISNTTASKVNLEGGNDNITISSASGLEVRGGDDADYMTTTSSTDLILKGDAGFDNITSSYGNVTLDAEFINVTDSNDGTGKFNTVELTLLDNTLSVKNSEFGGTVLMNFIGATNLNINLNAKNNSNALDNLVTISSLSMDTSVTGNAGNDKVVINTVVDNWFSFNGGDGTGDTLVVYYQEGKNTGTMSSTTITGAGTKSISYSNLEKIEIRLNNAANTFTVKSVNSITDIYAGSGNDTIVVESAEKKINVNGEYGNDTLVMQLSDSVTLDANTFKDVGVTTEILEIKNVSTTNRNFMVSDEKIYSETSSGILLLDMSSALSAGTLKEVKLTGNSSDTLTIDDTAITDEALGVVINDDKIEYGKGGLPILNSVSPATTGLPAALFDGISFVAPYFHNTLEYNYYPVTDPNAKWSYATVDPFDKTKEYITEMAPSTTLWYTDKDNVAKSIKLYNSDRDGYWDIDSAEQFYALMRLTNSGLLSSNFELKNDIDMSGHTNQQAIGSMVGDAKYFTGTFEGNGYKISGVELSNNLTYRGNGLFSRVGGSAVIKNFELYGASITAQGSGMNAGGIIGTIQNSASTAESSVVNGITIENITIKNSTITSSGGGRAGGIIGKLDLNSSSVTVKNCLIDNSKVVGSFSGGMVGDVKLIDWSKLTLERCKVDSLGYSGTNITNGGLIDNVYLGSLNTAGYIDITECAVTDSAVRSGLWNVMNIRAWSSVNCTNTIVSGGYIENGSYVDKNDNGAFSSTTISFSSVNITNCKFALSGVINGIGNGVTLDGGTNQPSSFKVDKCTVDGSNAESMSTGCVNTFNVGIFGGATITNNIFVFNVAAPSTAKVIAQNLDLKGSTNDDVDVDWTVAGNWKNVNLSDTGVETIEPDAVSDVTLSTLDSALTGSSVKSGYGFDGTTYSSEYGCIPVTDSGTQVSGYFIPQTAFVTSAAKELVFGINSDRDNVFCYEKWQNSSGLEKSERAHVTLADSKIQFLTYTPDKNYLIAVTDSDVHAYKVNASNGSLTAVAGSVTTNMFTAHATVGSRVYLANEVGDICITSGSDTAWVVSTNKTDAISAEYGPVTKLVVSSDQKTLYSLHKDSGVIEVFGVNADGSLTLNSVIREGVNGVRGIAGVTGVVESKGYLFACGAADDTIAVFTIGENHKSFTQEQYMRNGSGITGMENPIDIEEQYYGVTVHCKGATSSSSIKINLHSTLTDSDPNTNPPEPDNLWVMSYSGLDKISLKMSDLSDKITITDAAVDNLEILSNGGGDLININSAIDRNSYTINTGAGDDTLNIHNSTSSVNFTVSTDAGKDRFTAGLIGGTSVIDTGADNDTVEISTVLSGSNLTLNTQDGDDNIKIGNIEAGVDSGNKTSVTVDAGVGNDTIEVKTIGDNVTALLQGSLNDDELIVYGAGIASSAEVYLNGNTAAYYNLTEVGNDTLTYYGTPSNLPLTPTNGVIASATDTTVVSYWTMDTINLPGASLLAKFQVTNTGDIFEGDSITLSGAGSEIPVASNVKYEWDLNNDGVYDVSSTTAVKTVTWATMVAAGLIDDGSYNMTMRLSANGKTSKASTNVRIKNKKRTILLSGDPSVQEDVEYTLTLDKNDSSEKGDDTISSWVVDWGDGTILTYAADSTSIKHTYADTGSYTIKAKAYDEDGSTETTKGLTVTADPRAHIVVISGDNETVNEGSTYTLKVKSERPQGQSGTWNIDWGDGTNTVVTYATKTFEAWLTHVYTDGSSEGKTYDIKIELLDVEGRFTDTHSVKVLNVDPSTTLTGSATVNEGAEYELTIKAPTDPGDDTVSKYIVDWGDGSVENIDIEFASQDYVAKHNYADAGVTGESYTIKVAIVDEDGQYDDVVTKSITVDNLAPTITFEQAGSTTETVEGSFVRISGLDYSDPGLDTVAGWIVDWGDGTVASYTPAEVVAATTGFEHLYDNAGEYEVKVSAWDEDYSQGTALSSGVYTVTVTTVEDNNTDTSEPAPPKPAWTKPTLDLADSVDSIDEGVSYALTLSNYVYDFQGDKSIDDIQIDWGDGSVESISSRDFLAMSSGDNVIVYHTYEDDGSMNISITYKDTETSKGALDSEAVIPVGDPETNDGVVLKDGEPYYKGRRMVTDFGIIFSPGMITEDVAGTPTEFYQEIINDNGVYKLRKYAVNKTTVEYQNDNTLDLTVNDVAPELVISGKDSVMQGNKYSLKLSEITDVSGDTATQYTVDWGDGTSTVINSSSIGGGESVEDARTLTHVYSLEGEKNITVSSIISDGTTYNTSISNTLNINVEDAPMDIALSGPVEIGELKEYTLTLGVITDPATPSANVIPSKWVVDWGDGNVEEIVNTANELTKDVVHTFYGTPNFIYDVSVGFTASGTDYESSKVHNVKVINNPPVVSLTTATTSIDEGSSYIASYVFSDDGSDAKWSVKVDYGDGSAIQTFDLTVKEFSLDHVYADNGNYDVTVNVTDERGAVSVDSVTAVTVSNVLPTATLTGIASSPEGAEYILTIGGAVDPGADTITSYKVDWGDGSSTTISAVDLAATSNVLKHTFADNATPSINLTITDEDGVHVDVTTKDIAITNVLPTTALSGLTTITEGSEYELTVGAITDPGDDTITTYKVDWGDGNTTTVSAGDLAIASSILKHTYTDNINAIIKLTVIDEDGTHSDIVSKGVTVTNIVPTTTLSGLNLITEGSEYTLAIGAITDPGDDTITNYKVDWGDGNTTAISSADLASASNLVKHTYNDDGAMVIKVTLSDEDGTHDDVVSKNLTVSNVVPVTSISGVGSVEEGDVFTLTVQPIVDPGDDTATTYIIDWGDGIIENIAVVDQTQVQEITHVFDDNSGSYTINISVVDEDLTHLGVASTTVEVTNVNPSLNIDAGEIIVMQSLPFEKVAALVDASNSDTLDVYVDFNNGEGEKLLSVGTLRNAVITNAYEKPGTYAVKLYVKDDDGGISSVYSFSVNVVAIPGVEAESEQEGESEEAEDVVGTRSAILGPDVDRVGDETDNVDPRENTRLGTVVAGRHGRTVVGGGSTAPMVGSSGASNMGLFRDNVLTRMIYISDLIDGSREGGQYDDMGEQDPQTDGQGSDDGQEQETQEPQLSVRRLQDISLRMNTDRRNADNLMTTELLVLRLSAIANAQQQLVDSHQDNGQELESGLQVPVELVNTQEEEV